MQPALCTWSFFTEDEGPWPYPEWQFWMTEAAKMVIVLNQIPHPGKFHECWLWRWKSIPGLQDPFSFMSDFHISASKCFSCFIQVIASNINNGVDVVFCQFELKKHMDQSMQFLPTVVSLWAIVMGCKLFPSPVPKIQETYQQTLKHLAMANWSQNIICLIIIQTTKQCF